MQKKVADHNRGKCTTYGEDRFKLLNFFRPKTGRILSYMISNDVVIVFVLFLFAPI